MPTRSSISSARSDVLQRIEIAKELDVLKRPRQAGCRELMRLPSADIGAVEDDLSFIRAEYARNQVE
jgi:hypothetical protein